LSTFRGCSRAIAVYPSTKITTININITEDVKVLVLN
jgi:hypothetical protein